MRKLLLTIFFLIPILCSAQWSSTQIGSATYNSTLRPMNQGVYDIENDKSFFCFMQENSNPYVVTCDHSSGKPVWNEPVKVLTQPTASKYNYPTIGILPDKRLVLACAYPFDKYIGFAISDKPSDASTWTITKVSTGRTHIEYPRIKVDNKGNIFIFYVQQPDTKAAHKRWYYYVKSTDCGLSWSTPVLSFERDLNDPYGMCEMYIGYTVNQPNSDEEKWWFSFTSSSGFQYIGTHTGLDNSSVLTDINATWGTGANMGYRWLYNVTKNTNSGITSATSSTVTPTQQMDWDNGDKYGIAYHNINHSDIYLVYFKPLTGHWYNVNDEDLSEKVSRDEMESLSVRAYTSPTPPSTKDVGYVPNVVVDNNGIPATLQNGKFYKWNGSSWSVITPTLPNGDMRFIWFANGKYYIAVNGVNVYQSNDLINWSLVGSSTLINNHGYSLYCTPILNGHSDAFFNVHEYDETYAGFAWSVSLNQTLSTNDIYVETNDSSDIITANAYSVNTYLGSRTKIYNEPIELSITDNNGSKVQIQDFKYANGKSTWILSNTGKTSVVKLVFRNNDITAEKNILIYNTLATNIKDVKSDVNVYSNNGIYYSVTSGYVNKIEVYDIYGRLISTPVNQYHYSGCYNLNITQKGILIIKVFHDENTHFFKVIQ